MFLHYLHEKVLPVKQSVPGHVHDLFKTIDLVAFWHRQSQLLLAEEEEPHLVIQDRGGCGVQTETSDAGVGRLVEQSVADCGVGNGIGGVTHGNVPVNLLGLGQVQQGRHVTLQLLESC